MRERRINARIYNDWENKNGIESQKSTLIRYLDEGAKLK